MKLLFWKKSGKSLDFWIQISVRALCLVPVCKVPDPTPTIQLFLIKTYHHQQQTTASTVTYDNVFFLLFAGDVPLEVLTQIVGTISDPSAMLGPEVCYTLEVFCVRF